MSSKDKGRDPPRVEGDYDVGYGKPPVRSRFRAGQSGNPAGRRKGVRNLATDVKRVLSVPVKVTEHGRRRRISTQEAVLTVLRELALRRDGRSVDRLLELARLYNNAPDEVGPDQPLAAEDQAILDAFVETIAATATTAAVRQDKPRSPDPKPKRRARA